MDQGLIALSLLSAVISFGLGIGFWLTLQRLRSLSAATEPSTSDLVVSVIVPARNEEHDLERALRSILAQESVQVRVVVVNDHSTDRTGEIADSLADGNDRITVIHDPPLVDGWLGNTRRRCANAELVLDTGDSL